MHLVYSYHTTPDPKTGNQKKNWPICTDPRTRKPIWTPSSSYKGWTSLAFFSLLCALMFDALNHLQQSYLAPGLARVDRAVQHFDGRASTSGPATSAATSCPLRFDLRIACGANARRMAKTALTPSWSCSTRR